MKRYSLGWLLLFVLAFQGCLQNRPDGHYEGTLSRSQGEKFESKVVGIDIKTTRNSALIEVTAFKGSKGFEAKLVKRSGRHFELTLPSIQSHEFKMKKVGDCLVSTVEDQILRSNYVVKGCYDGRNFLLKVETVDHVPVLSLHGDRFSKEKPILYEAPKKAYLSEMIQQALKRSFTSRLEYETLFQAKMEVQSAYASLLPRINFGTIAFNATTSVMTLPLTMLSCIGDLAPFLLPNRWIQAKASTYLHEAERVTQKLMSADLAVQVEGLAYIHLRDRNIYRFYSQLVPELETLRASVAEMENRGLVEKGVAVQLQDSLDLMKIDLTRLETFYKVGLYALSHLVGNKNPNGIEEVIDDSDQMRIEDASLVNAQDLADLAVSRSFELRQIDFMHLAVRLERADLTVAWLDPQADPKKSIGLALVPQFKIAKSHLKELEIKREQIQTIVTQKAFECSTNYNEALKVHSLAKSLFEKASRSMNKLYEQIGQGNYEMIEKFPERMENIIASYVRMETIRTAFRLERSRMDRMELRGQYLRLKPESVPLYTH